ncbi:hypothetical protein T484DRAFT_2492646 [Baffinella frigidus]|nr:hypothetical protein T484DRAFT_2492646 [Cryptophyta sp. CCMP2293]
MEEVSAGDPRQIRAALEQEQEIIVEKLRSMTAVKAIAQQHSLRVVEAAQGILASKTKEWVQGQSDSAVAEFQSAAQTLPVAFPADFDAAYQGLLGSVSAGLQGRLRADGADAEAEVACLAAFARAAEALEQAMVALNAEKLAATADQMASSVALFGAKLALLPAGDPVETARSSGEEVEATMRGFREAVPIEAKCEELRVTLERTAAAFREGRTRAWANQRAETAAAEFDTSVAALPVTAEAEFSAALGETLRASVGGFEKEVQAAGVSGGVASESVVALSAALKERVAEHENRNRKAEAAREAEATRQAAVAKAQGEAEEKAKAAREAESARQAAVAKAQGEAEEKAAAAKAQKEAAEKAEPAAEGRKLLAADPEALIAAARAGDIDKIHQIVAAGGNVEVKDSEVCLACGASWYFDLVSLLLVCRRISRGISICLF